MQVKLQSLIARFGIPHSVLARLYTRKARIIAWWEERKGMNIQIY